MSAGAFHTDPDATDPIAVRISTAVKLT